MVSDRTGVRLFPAIITSARCGRNKALTWLTLMSGKRKRVHVPAPQRCGWWTSGMARRHNPAENHVHGQRQEKRNLAQPLGVGQRRARAVCSLPQDRHARVFKFETCQRDPRSLCLEETERCEWTWNEGLHRCPPACCVPTLNALACAPQQGETLSVLRARGATHVRRERCPPSCGATTS